MRILSYEEFVETCRAIIENGTDCDTEGWTYDYGRYLVIEFGIEKLSIKVGLYYDEITGYRKAYLNLFVDLDYRDDVNSLIALDVINCLKPTMLELHKTLSDCRIDYIPEYEGDDFMQYKWKLPIYGEK